MVPQESYDDSFIPGIDVVEVVIGIVFMALRDIGVIVVVAIPMFIAVCIHPGRCWVIVVIPITGGVMVVV